MSVWKSIISCLDCKRERKLQKTSSLSKSTQPVCSGECLALGRLAAESSRVAKRRRSRSNRCFPWNRCGAVLLLKGRQTTSEFSVCTAFKGQIISCSESMKEQNKSHASFLRLKVNAHIVSALTQQLKGNVQIHILKEYSLIHFCHFIYVKCEQALRQTVAVFAFYQLFLPIW